MYPSLDEEEQIPRYLNCRRLGYFLVMYVFTNLLTSFLLLKALAGTLDVDLISPT